eukprot:scaffold1771_cov343-Pavlova_lutheri.AAC.15
MEPVGCFPSISHSFPWIDALFPQLDGKGIERTKTTTTDAVEGATNASKNEAMGSGWDANGKGWWIVLVGTIGTTALACGWWKKIGTSGTHVSETHAKPNRRNAKEGVRSDGTPVRAEGKEENKSIEGPLWEHLVERGWHDAHRPNVRHAENQPTPETRGRKTRNRAPSEEDDPGTPDPGTATEEDEADVGVDGEEEEGETPIVTRMRRQSVLPSDRGTNSYGGLHPIDSANGSANQSRIHSSLHSVASAEEKHPRVVYSKFQHPEEVFTEETEEVCAMMHEMLQMRDKYLFRSKEDLGPEGPSRPMEEAKVPTEIRPQPFEHKGMEKVAVTYRMVKGVVHVYPKEGDGTPLYKPPADDREFFTDMHRMLKHASLGPVRTLTYHRLLLLEQKFQMYLMLNADREFLSQKTAPHRDFYNVRKVDTHIHHSACMNQKHLLRFIKSKLRKEPNEVVIFRNGKYLTLKEVFESLNLTAYELSVDTLDMHADKSTFHRFDKFNLKYNPCGQSRLREVFIKQDNLIQGRYLAELTRQVMDDLEAAKYQMAEYRVSIYGRRQNEWDQLSSWIVDNKLYSDNVLWMIQIPRLYNVYKDIGLLNNFQQFLDNIFLPLFEVTVDPSTHPQLHVFLQMVVAFDMVDDESKPERRPTKTMRTPEDWDLPFNPAFSYYVYYIGANLHVLNQLREARGLNCIKFMPHAGEAGDVDHLVSTFMWSHSIAHGINLRKSPCLQYLYYLKQIGLAVSPLSNNNLFLDYHRNPFPTFFNRGLNVSLSTDDPLMIHFTKEPLVEEYSVAAQVWKLSSCDLCEIARNSVLQSFFPNECKMHWVSKTFWKPGVEGNEIEKTNVPHERLAFRYDTLQTELDLVERGAALYYEKNPDHQKFEL